MVLEESSRGHSNKDEPRLRAYRADGTIEIRSVSGDFSGGRMLRKKPRDFLVLGASFASETSLWNKSEEKKSPPPPLVSTGVARLTSYRC